MLADARHDLLAFASFLQRYWRQIWSTNALICPTNAIGSLNARYRRAVRALGHFPTEPAALKCLYLVTRNLDPTVRGCTRWTMRWKPALSTHSPSPSPTAGRPRRLNS